MYKTSELPLVVTLRCLGFESTGTERDNGRVSFLFPQSVRLQQRVTEYYNHEVKVEPFDFYSTLKQVKQQIKLGE